jgi:hypothetical protein
MYGPTTSPDSPTAMAQVLAMVMSMHEQAEPNAMRLLTGLNAFKRIGVSKPEFLRLTRSCRKGACHDLPEHDFPHLQDLEAIDEILDSVHDAKHRLLLCRLAGCLITADGHIRDMERAVYDRMLQRWGYTRASVTRAILTQHVH